MWYNVNSRKNRHLISTYKQLLYCEYVKTEKPADVFLGAVGTEA